MAIAHMRYLIILGLLMFPLLHWWYDGDYKAIALSTFSVWSSMTHYTFVAPGKWLWQSVFTPSAVFCPSTGNLKI